jgi:hypothetical protein
MLSAIMLPAMAHKACFWPVGAAELTSRTSGIFLLSSCSPSLSKHARRRPQQRLSKPWRAVCLSLSRPSAGVRVVLLVRGLVAAAQPRRGDGEQLCARDVYTHIVYVRTCVCARARVRERVRQLYPDSIVSCDNDTLARFI